MAVVRRDESASRQLSREGRDAFPFSATTCIPAPSSHVLRWGEAIIRSSWYSTMEKLPICPWLFHKQYKEQAMINSVKAPCDEGVLRSKPVHTPSAPHAGIWILVATILGSSMAFIDGSVVNVALPVLLRDLNATSSDVQWVVEVYSLFLSTSSWLGEPWATKLGVAVSMRWAFLSFRSLLSGAACRRLLLSSSSHVRCKGSAARCSFPAAWRSSAHRLMSSGAAKRSGPGLDLPRLPQ